MCASFKKKIPPSFSVIWHGTFWSEFNLLKTNMEAGWGGCYCVIPGKSAGLITAIPFQSVLWHPAHKEFSLIHMNLMNIYTSKEFQERVQLITPHASQIAQYLWLPQCWGHFFTGPPAFRSISRFSVGNIVTKR